MRAAFDDRAPRVHKHLANAQKLAGASGGV
jgi:hypothetical protein